MISWEKSIIEKIIQPNSETLAVVQRQFFFLCGNSFSCAANTWAQFSLTTETTAQYVQRQFLFLHGKILQRFTTKTTFVNRSWIAAQEIDQTKPTPFFLCSSAGIALSYATCQIDSKVICISFHHIIKWDISWVFEFCRPSGWAVPGIHTILVLFAPGRCLLSLFSFFYRKCDHWAPFSLPMYH